MAIRLALGGSVGAVVRAGIRPLVLCVLGGGVLGLLGGRAIGQIVRASTLGLPAADAMPAYIAALGTICVGLLIGAIPHVITARAVQVTDLLKTD